MTDEQLADVLRQLDVVILTAQRQIDAAKKARKALLAEQEEQDHDR